MSSDVREFRFINGTGRRLLLVLEPDSREFWIAQGSLLQIQAGDGAGVLPFEVELLSRALVVYLPRGVEARIYQDGLEVQVALPSRGFWRRFDHCTSTD